MNDIQPVSPCVFDIKLLIGNYENEISNINLKLKRLKKHLRSLKKLQKSESEFHKYLSDMSGVSQELMGPKE